MVGHSSLILALVCKRALYFEDFSPKKTRSTKEPNKNHFLSKNPSKIELFFRTALIILHCNVGNALSLHRGISAKDVLHSIRLIRFLRIGAHLMHLVGFVILDAWNFVIRFYITLSLH